MNLPLYSMLCLALLTACQQAVWPAGNKWVSYFQLRYTNAEDLKGYLGLRRLKLYGQGVFARDWQYYVQLLYKTNNRSATDGFTIQEFSLTRSLGRTRITLGQFKPPFGMERFTPDWKLAVIDRAQSTDRLIPFGSVGNSFARGRGIQWDTTLGSVGVALGLFDGNGANQSFAGNGPLLAGRTIYEKYVAPGLLFHTELAAAFRYDRNMDFTAQLPGAPIAYRRFRGRDARSDLAAALETEFWSMRAEYLRARYLGGDAGIPDLSAEGYYVQYSGFVSRRVALAARYEVFDPNRFVIDSKDIAWSTVGLNWHIRGDFEKLQVNYVFKREKSTELDDDTLMVQYQRFL